MYLIFIYWLLCNGKKVFEQNYNVSELNIDYQLEQNHAYLIQFDITAQPQNKNCFPIFKITNNETEFQTQNSYSYSQKQLQRQIWIPNRTVNQQIMIQIYSQIENIYNEKNNQDCYMEFYLSIFDFLDISNLQDQCKFPTYGKNCEQAINFIDIDLLIQITVNKYSWFFGYYQLNNLNYNLKITNFDQKMGISIILGKEQSFNLLPNFLQNYFLIPENDTLIINLNDMFNQQQNQIDYFIYFGIFNEDLNKDQSIILELNKKEEFIIPKWAIYTVIFVIIIGIIIGLTLHYFYKRKLKEIHYVKPALDEKHLNQYMPAQKMNKDYLNQECGICLELFIQKDKFRITPCGHIFHDLCFKDWTKKNTTCPMCRQGLKQEEIQQFYSKVNSNQNESQDLSQKPTINKLIPLVFDDATCDQQNKSDGSPQNNSNVQQSLQLISDAILEN